MRTGRLSNPKWAFLIAWAATACGGSTSAAGTGDAGPGIDVAPDAGIEADGGDGSACAQLGPVAFHLRVADGSTARYCIGAGCTLEWLSVSDAHDVRVPHHPGCSLRCSDCLSGGCNPICLTPQLMKAGGEVVTWDGNLWPSSMCKGQMSCTYPTCAVAGRYVAKMCAREAGRRSDGSAFCDPTSTEPMVCIDVAFEYPTAQLVSGILP